jgi:hypothetical protein
MESPLRPEVLELIRVCEKLAGQDNVLTVRENGAVARCARDLDKKVLSDCLQVAHQVDPAEIVLS